MPFDRKFSNVLGKQHPSNVSEASRHAGDDHSVLLWHLRNLFVRGFSLTAITYPWTKLSAWWTALLGCRHATKVNFEQLQNLTMINFLDAEGLKLFLQLVRDGLGVAASDDRAIRYVVKSRTMQAIWRKHCVSYLATLMDSKDQQALINISLSSLSLRYANEVSAESKKDV